MSKKYPMCGDQPAQIDCRDTECKFHEDGSCVNMSPAITLNPNSRFTCWSKQSPEPEQQPPSESEREKIQQQIKAISETCEYRLTIAEESNGMGTVKWERQVHDVSKLICYITDFILSRDKEKDAEIERLNQDIESLTVTVKTLNKELTSWHGKAKELESENERLKGEREEHAKDFAHHALSQAVESSAGIVLDAPMKTIYTEYLKSNNK